MIQFTLYDKRSISSFYLADTELQSKNLRTTEGMSLILIEKGFLNPNSGPDFIGAKIRIDDMLWIGNIEIHIKASDWEKHGHQHDVNYNNVVLHVVMEEDSPVYNEQGIRIPCLELKKRINRNALKKYSLLQKNNFQIPCKDHISTIPEIHISHAVEKALVERHQKKSDRLVQFLNRYNNDWEHSFFILLSRNFGVYVNTEPFEQMALTIPPLTLRKERFSLINLESLLFGQSGFLSEELKDDYSIELFKMYSFLQLKYKLKPIKSQLWKFMRMRPGNFPSIRLAQLAALIHKHDSFISHLKQHTTKKEIFEFLNATTSPYWHSHFTFDNHSEKAIKTISTTFKSLLLINTISIFYFTYGSLKKQDTFKERAIDVLNQLKPEENKFIRQWKSLGIVPKSAYESQGLLGLYQNYCLYKKCLDCPIGRHIMKK